MDCEGQKPCPGPTACLSDAKCLTNFLIGLVPMYLSLKRASSGHGEVSIFLLTFCYKQKVKMKTSSFAPGKMWKSLDEVSTLMAFLLLLPTLSCSPSFSARYYARLYLFTSCFMFLQKADLETVGAAPGRFLEILVLFFY